jgi:hypothetical protein
MLVSLQLTTKGYKSKINFHPTQKWKRSGIGVQGLMQYISYCDFEAINWSFLELPQ